MSFHRRQHPLCGVIATVAIVWGATSLSGCQGASSSATGSTQSAPSQIAPASTSGTSAAPSGPASGSSAATNTAAAATNAAASNPLFSLRPGGQSVRQGFVNAGHRRLEHRRVYTITDVTKVVDGVTATVALDQDFDGGELAEQSLEILALDNDKNIQYLGSYTEAYEGGQFVNFTDSWLSGVKGGKSGVLVPGHPQVGAQFTQAVVPGEGTATARVTKIGEKKCVPFRCFSDLVVVEEKGAELKYYAPGVGGVLTAPLTGGAQETEELINVTTLSRTGLDEISNEVLTLDQHARAVSADVYGHSAPAHRTT
jgi:hypothetical protein